MNKANAFKISKCPVCGKAYIITDGEMWGYQIQGKRFCSYHCMRTYEIPRLEKKNKAIKAELERYEKPKPFEYKTEERHSIGEVEGVEQVGGYRAYYVTYNGVRKSLAQWAEELGCTKGTLYNRISVTGSVEKALTTPIHNRGQHKARLSGQRMKYKTEITVDGKTLTIMGWAEELGCKVSTIYKRIRNGMSPEEAVIKPIRDYYKGNA